MNHHKGLVLVGLSLFSLLLAVGIVNLIAEQFFFDKLILNKSEKFGYSSKIPTFDLLNQETSPALESRIVDIRQLVDQEKYPDSRVLGSTTDDEIFTVALIGDSFVYGTGVQVKNRIGNQLETKLNQIKPSKVYNLAQSGDSILDNYAKLQLAEKHLQPDVMVVVLVENDTYLDYPDKYPGGQAIFERIVPLCAGEIRKFDYTNVVTGDDVTNLVDYPSWSPEYANACVVQHIVREMNQRENLFYVALSRPLDIQELEKTGSNTSTINLSKMMTQYISYVTESNGPVLIPSQEFTYKPVSAREGHSSPQTNTEYANMIFNELTNNPKWKFISD